MHVQGIKYLVLSIVCHSVAPRNFLLAGKTLIVCDFWWGIYIAILWNFNSVFLSVECSIYLHYLVLGEQWSVITMKILRSWHLGIWAAHKCNQSVNSSKNGASNRLAWPTSISQIAFIWWPWPIDFAHFPSTNAHNYPGSGHQHYLHCRSQCCSDADKNA